MAALEFVFSSFFVFIGTLMLATIVGKVVMVIVLGMASLIRGVPVRLVDGEKTTDAEIETAVRAALAAGRLDADLARAARRNEQRRGA